VTLADKLAPTRVRTSGKFTAILGFILDEEWTDPAITELVCTSDGMLLAATTDDPLCDDIIGDIDHLERNLEGIADVAGLTARERKTLLSLAKTRITDWRR